MQNSNYINILMRNFIPFIVIVLVATTAFADDAELRMGQGVPVAVGIGAEVSSGDYGSNAGVTIVRVPVVVSARPADSIDVTIELPVIFLTSNSGSGVVVTQGGAGRGRGAGASTTTTTTSADKVSAAGLGDINMSVGWTVLQDSAKSPKVRPTLYLKVPTGDQERGLGTGTFEAGPGISVSKWLGSFQLFAEGAYIFQDSSSNYQGKNYVSYSVGGGVQATDRILVSLYAKGSSARVSDGVSPVEGRLKLNFMQSRRVSWEVYALAGFTDASPAAGGGIFAMYLF